MGEGVKNKLSNFSAHLIPSLPGPPLRGSGSSNVIYWGSKEIAIFFVIENKRNRRSL